MKRKTAIALSLITIETTVYSDAGYIQPMAIAKLKTSQRTYTYYDSSDKKA